MKKKFFSRSALLLLAVTTMSSCQKQIQQSNNKAGDVLAKTGNNANLENRCRLLVDMGLSDGFIQSYHYNEMGLADELKLYKPGAFDWNATMAYGSRNEITNAIFYYSPADYYDIVFTYEKNKIATEFWYIPGTSTRVDGYINTYNNRGQLVKRDEPDYGLYTLYNYDAKGNPVKVEIYDYADVLWFGYELAYAISIKNPFLAVTGLPESIFFTDAMEGPNRFTGLKQYFNDDQGNQIVFFQWKSEETELLAGNQNLAVYQKSIDAIGGQLTDQTWTYENRAGNSEAAHNDHAVATSKGNSLKQLLHARKTSHYKQDLINFKKAYL